jgi:hypothetical protein
MLLRKIQVLLTGKKGRTDAWRQATEHILKTKKYRIMVQWLQHDSISPLHV